MRRLLRALAAVSLLAAPLARADHAPAHDSASATPAPAETPAPSAKSPASAATAPPANEAPAPGAAAATPSTPPATTPAAPPGPPAPIGLSDFARFPYGTLPTLSPDGSEIAVVFRTEEDRALAVRSTADDGPPTRLLGKIKDNPRWLRWPKAERVLLSLERYQVRTPLKALERPPEPPRPIYRYNPFTRRMEMVGFDMPPLPPEKELPAGRVAYVYSFRHDRSAGRHLGRDWTDAVPIQDDVISWLPADPKHVLVALDEVDRFGSPHTPNPSVRAMSVGNGGLRNVVHSDRHIQRWFADHDGNVMLGESDRADGSTALFRRDGNKLVLVPTYVPTLEVNARFAAHSYDPNLVYVWAPVEGRQALLLLHLADSSVEGVYANPSYDVTGPLVFDETQRKLVGVGYVADTIEFQALDPSLADERARMGRAVPGVALEVVSESADKKLALVRASSDVRPPAYYLYDRGQHTMRIELLEYPRLEHEALQPMVAVRYFARDGLEIPAYLTRPPGNPEKAPAIVMVHDGPAERVHRGFDPLVQWLARNGFAVLEPNYRGSSGYGQKLRAAGSGEWGLTMEDDLEDAAKWLASEKIADPQRIGIYGRGYGGYAALIGVLRAGSPFRSAVSHGGPTDLVQLLEDDEKGRVEPDWSASVLGAVKKKKKSLVELSPIAHVAQLDRPVLLLHSEHDERVRFEQSQSFQKAAAKAGKSVELVEFEGELSELAREKNRVLWFEKLTSFFQQTLAAPPAAPPPAETPQTEEKSS